MRVILKTSRLTVCPIGTEFLESTHAYAADIENTRYMMHLPNDSVEDTRAFLLSSEAEWAKESPEFYEFALLLEGRHIGACSLYLDDEGRSAELGWLVVKDFWRNGYAVEAARAVACFAADHLGVKEFIAHCDSENVGSYRVMEKLGMTRVSVTGGRSNKSADRDSMEMLYTMPAECIDRSGGEYFVIREMKPEEYHLLDDFLYEAIFLPEGVEPPPREIISRPELRLYTENFGGQHDRALVALTGGKPVGAVWTRIMNDYGHIDDDTPSFAIALYEQYRGRGVGTLMMTEMLDILRKAGYAQASLAVQKANYAVGMYKKVGFEITGENEEEYIMVCRLKGESDR